MRRKHSWLLMLVIGLLVTTSTAAQDSTTFPTLPGQIAYIGTDQNVYTLDLDDSSRTTLSSNSSPGRIYQWPTWSTDGRLAYFLTNVNVNQFSTEVFVSPDGKSAGESAYVGENAVFNYAYWSPQDCVTESPNEDCRELAVLLSDAGEDGLFVELIRDGSELTSTRRIGTGAPFYFSWSPDGTRMLWQRDNERLDIFDTTTNNVIETLNVMSGAFRAPAWSPIDDRLLVATMNNDRETTDLVIVTSAEPRVLVNNLSGPVSFVWSPNGDYVAYTDQQGPLWVVDSSTGALVAQSAVSGVGAFFWSPDSQQVAYITLAPATDTFTAQNSFRGKLAAFQPEPVEIAWSVLNIRTSINRSFGAFFPTREMLYMLVYFDQFAQSHRIWSPDSRYLIYAEITPNDQAVINLLDTTQTDAVPFALADGLIGIWSFQ